MSSIHCKSAPPSFLNLVPSTATPTTCSISNPLHAAASSKQARRPSLGLIDSARARWTKDFYSLVRANTCSKSAERPKPVHPVQVQDADAHIFVYPGYAPFHSLELADPDIEIMDMSYQGERHERSLGARLVEFLSRSRSRSRSKKRRSRSLELPPVFELPRPSQSSSIGHHTHLAGAVLADGNNTSTSTSSSASGSKPLTRSPSRPLSGATTATDTTIKPRKKMPQVRAASATTPTPPEHRVRLRTDVIDSGVTLPRKTKKMNIFSVAIASSKKYSFMDRSRPNSPDPTNNRSTPNNVTVKTHRAGLASRFRSGSSSSTGGESSRSRSRTAVHETPPPLPPKTGDAKRMRRSTQIPQAQKGSTHKPSNSMPSRGEYAQPSDDIAADESDLDGRCTPLCLPSSKRNGSGALDKGKEKERPRGSGERSRQTSRDRSRDRSQEEQRKKDREKEAIRVQEKEKGRELEKVKEKGKEKEKEVGITHPRRVGSPSMKDLARDVRSPVGVVPIQKVSSGGGSNSSWKSSSKDSGANAIKTNRTKHGSFDFERPMSATGGYSTRIALQSLGINPDDDRVGSAQSLQRSNSARGPAIRLEESSRYTNQATTGSLGRSTKLRPLPLLDVDIDIPTMSSQPNSAIPISANSSNSGHSGSLGRSAGARVLRATHTHRPFMFEPAVPPIPGSPADEGRSSFESPSKSRRERAKGKGRSLDLGLTLSWAPQRMKEEAVLSYGRTSSKAMNNLGRTRGRYRTAGVDEEGRLETSSSKAATDVAQAFKEALGDKLYGTFKGYVHRYDAEAIPLDGPYGLISHVRRLLDTAAALDERGKTELLNRFHRIVQENQ